jgi:hypothetical protein
MTVMVFMGLAAFPFSQGKEPVARTLQDETTSFYQVSIQSSSNCVGGATPTSADRIQGKFIVRVEDASGSPVRNADLSLLLVSNGSDKEYSQAAKTSLRGRAVMLLDIDVKDAGTSLWCSIAVDNPSLPPSLSQQVPCSFTAAACDP